MDQPAVPVSYFDILVEHDPSLEGILTDHRARFAQRDVRNLRGIRDVPAVGVDQRVAAVAQVEKIKGQRPTPRAAGPPNRGPVRRCLGYDTWIKPNLCLTIYI